MWLFRVTIILDPDQDINTYQSTIVTGDLWKHCHRNNLITGVTRLIPLRTWCGYVKELEWTD